MYTQIVDKASFGEFVEILNELREKIKEKYVSVVVLNKTIY